MGDGNTNDWGEYKRLILDNHKIHHEHFVRIFDKLGQINVEIASLRVKASLWGGLGGAIPAAIAVAWTFLKN